MKFAVRLPKSRAQTSAEMQQRYKLSYLYCYRFAMYQHDRILCYKKLTTPGWLCVASRKYQYNIHPTSTSWISPLGSINLYFIIIMVLNNFVWLGSSESVLTADDVDLLASSVRDSQLTLWRSAVNSEAVRMRVLRTWFPKKQWLLPLSCSPKSSSLRI